MENEELRMIGFYVERLAAERNSTVLNNDERFELRELLKKWLAEVEEEPITVEAPSSWGDVRKKY